jgi:hypothetical protein
MATDGHTGAIEQIYTLMLHKFLDAGAVRVVFSGSRAGFSNRSIVDTM